MGEPIETAEHPASISELLKDLRANGVSPSVYKSYIDRFLDTKARKAGIPRSGQFELTPLCNLDCKMCYVHLEKDQLKNADILSGSQWKGIMQHAFDSGMTKACLSGGECLAHPDFDEIFLFLHSLGVEVSIKTNGVLLDDERIDFFRLHPPASIQITLYGASEEGYFKVTGRRQFETVYHNLLAANTAELPLTVAITPNRFMEDAKETIRLVHGMGIPFIINPQLSDPAEETGRSGQDLDIDIDEYVELLKLQRLLKGADAPLLPLKSLPDIGGSVSTSSIGIKCASGRSAFDVDWRGTLRGCCSFRQINASIWELGFSEAWRRVNMASEQYIFPPECNGCPYYDCCFHCPGFASQLAPDGHATPKLCARGKRIAKEGLGKLREV